MRYGEARVRAATAEAGPRDDRRLVGIEGMRAIAALSVLVYHVWLGAKLPPSGAVSGVDLGVFSQFFWHLQAGVTLFFVLSGFLLYRPYVAASLRGEAPPSLRGYLVNRALRVLPAYWAILAFTAVAFHRQLLHAPANLLTQVFLLQIYVPHFVDSGIVPAWSLAVEVTFYLLLPLLGGALVRRLVRRGVGPVRAAFVPAAVLFVVGLAAKAIRHRYGLGIVGETALPVRADWFSFGMALAVVRVLWEDGRVTFGRREGVAAGAGAVALLAAAALLHQQELVSPIGIETPIAAACALCLGLVVFGGRSPLVRFLTWPPVFLIGIASYSVFLWQFPIMQWLSSEDWTLAGRGGFVANLALVAGLTLAASAVTYRYVERPALRRKRAWRHGAAQADGATPPVETPAAAPAAIKDAV
jgi:peptidoglycan/LPS O-acetylase OafA/YrhL